MSQCYRVQLKASVSTTVDVSDKSVNRLELTEILPEEEMKEILKDLLKADGFEEGSNNRLSKKGEEGETIVYDLDKMEVTASLEESKVLSTEVTGSGSAWDDRTAARINAQQNLEKAKENAEYDLESQKDDLQVELTQKLKASEADRVKDIHEYLQQVYAESLKRKARQLGDVMEIHESKDQDNYELVIKVSQ